VFYECACYSAVYANIRDVDFANYVVSRLGLVPFGLSHAEGIPESILCFLCRPPNAKLTVPTGINRFVSTLISHCDLSLLFGGLLEDSFKLGLKRSNPVAICDDSEQRNLHVANAVGIKKFFYQS